MVIFYSSPNQLLYSTCYSNVLYTAADICIKNSQLYVVNYNLQQESHYLLNVDIINMI